MHCCFRASFVAANIPANIPGGTSMEFIRVLHRRFDPNPPTAFALPLFTAPSLYHRTLQFFWHLHPQPAADVRCFEPPPTSQPYPPNLPPSLTPPACPQPATYACCSCLLLVPAYLWVPALLPGARLIPYCAAGTNSWTQPATLSSACEPCVTQAYCAILPAPK